MRCSSLLVSVAILATVAASQTRLTTVQVASGLSRPVFATPAPGVPDTLFVIEQHSGRIRIVRSGQVLPAPFLDLGSRILTGSERGLLGLAFHPDYARNGFFYVNYTRAGDGATMIERYQVTANPDLADPLSATTVAGPIAQPFSNHNGGCLQFGPDGYLYVSMGDGGSAGDPSCNAQNGNSLLGKLLRLDVDAAHPHIPATNPFVSDPAFRDEIWSYGLRNPWRFSFDRLTGDLWIGDVGQNAVEEIDFQPAASGGGENYGWKIMEGSNCYSTSACPATVPACRHSSLVLPIQQYSHSFGCSVTGGYVYRGLAVPDLRGTYFYADYCSDRIWAMRYDGQTVSEHREITAELQPAGHQLGSIVSFGEDADGELLIVELSGSIWKLVPRGSDPARDLGFGTAGTHGVPRFDFAGRLDPGASGELRLSSALPGAASAVFFSNQNNPTQIAGFGTLVPYPIAFGVGYITDAQGAVAVGVQRTGAGVTAYAQWAVLDPAGPGGIALSNALAIVIP